MATNARERFPQFTDMGQSELLGILEDAAKNWLAHDGLWFQAVEQQHGLEAAIAADMKAWRHFTVIEARRIMERHRIAPAGGIPALVKALGFRLYALLNRQEVVEQSDTRVVFRMLECRVQSARKRKGLADFPCKPVGLVEYEWFARTIDPRIRTRCICCPPDMHPDDVWCAWEFTIDDG
ncbi:MAG: DUF6125 family protein [candidate division WOR-3 bacterium]